MAETSTSATAVAVQPWKGKHFSIARNINYQSQSSLFTHSYIPSTQSSHPPFSANMQIKNLAIAASVSAVVSAAPSTQSKTFGVVAIHSGSGVQNVAFNAAKGSIFAGLPNQGASCARPQEQQATFYINNGALYLYDQSATPQEIYVDRSGMGQGLIGYTTGAQPTPKNSEREGWTEKDGHLQFGGHDLIACPNSIDGAWSIWASAGIANPAGNTDCVSIAARVVETSNPNGCSYTA
ncbi:hypothetical protein N7527_006724 [Penicillium freii]|nr:hypothetical protein N7527_006724 [Penicillium freii]